MIREGPTGKYSARGHEGRWTDRPSLLNDHIYLYPYILEIAYKS